MDEVALQLIHVLELRTAHHLATLGTALPCLLARLVPAEVDVGGGEDVVHLAQHVTEKLVAHRVTDTEVTLPSPSSPAAAQHRVGMQHLLAVSRHLDLRDHRDPSGGCVGNDLPCLLLRVVSSVGTGCPLLCIAPVALYPPLHPVALGAIGGSLSEEWATLDLQAPAAGIGEVPVEAIELVPLHLVEQLLHLLHTEEVSALVQHQSAVLKPRLVLDLHSRDAGGQDQLAERLQGIADAILIGGSDPDAATLDGEGVGPGRGQLLVVNRADDRAVGVLRGELQGGQTRLAEVCIESLDEHAIALIRRGEDDRVPLGERYHATILPDHLLGHREQGRVVGGLAPAEVTAR